MLQANTESMLEDNQTVRKQVERRVDIIDMIKRRK